MRCLPFPQSSLKVASFVDRQRYLPEPFQSIRCRLQKLPSQISASLNMDYCICKGIIESKFRLNIFRQRNESSTDNSKFISKSLQSRTERLGAILKDQFLANGFVDGRRCSLQKCNSPPQGLLEIDFSYHCQFCDFLPSVKFKDEIYSNFMADILMRIDLVEIFCNFIDDFLLDESRIHVKHYKSLVPSKHIISLYGNIN